MAIEYTQQSDADLSSADLHAFFASTLAGEMESDGTVFLPGMYVMAFRAPDDERDETTRLFGFDHRVTATFRFTEPSLRDHNTAVMVDAVLAFHSRFAGRGVLLTDGEEAIIQWSPDEIVFSSHWEEWFEVEPVLPLIAGRTVRRLAQPLL